jgi:hypothetical protein
MHGCKKIEKEVTSSRETYDLIELLVKKINPS